jgi:hypothetical protein
MTRPAIRIVSADAQLRCGSNEATSHLDAPLEAQIDHRALLNSFPIERLLEKAYVFSEGAGKQLGILHHRTNERSIVLNAHMRERPAAHQHFSLGGLQLRIPTPSWPFGSTSGGPVAG